MSNPCSGRVKVAAIALAAALPVTAFAFENGPYVGLEGGVNWESNQSLDGAVNGKAKFKPGWVGGIVTGYSYDMGLRPELEISFRRNQLRKADLNGIGSLPADGFENAVTGMFNLWYDLKTPTGLFSKLHPYIGGGIGASQVRAQDVVVSGVGAIDANKLSFAAQAGAGLGFEITKNLIASVDYRYLEVNSNQYIPAGSDASNPIRASYHSNSLMGSLRFNFGLPPPPVAAYVAPPEPAYVPPPPPPAGPCTDTDGDGVCDAVDKCPGTPKGFKVDADGCIIEQKIILRSVNFEFNKDVLTAPAKSSLDEVGAALVGQPSLRVEIAGYTDSVGSAAYNLSLSKKRAAAVKNYLVSKGVSGSNLVSQGYGKAAPIATNATEEGRAENRRVEFSVLNKPANASVVTKGSTAASKSAAEGDPVGKKPVKKHKKAKKAAPKPTAQ